MSGFDVVGVVLAVLPLIVSGLEQYASGVETIKTVARAAQEFHDVARRLETENSIFRNNIELLLGDCVDVKTQKSLMDDVEGLTWQDPTVEAALKFRLDSSYVPYVETIRSIFRSLTKFRERLHIDAKGQLPFNDNYPFRQFCKRVKFALKKEKYLDLIVDIGRDNTRLDCLTKQTRELQATRSAHRVPDYETFRAGAKNLFDLLRRSLHVSCRSSHSASICLRPRDSDQSQMTSAKQADSIQAFRIVLSHDFQPEETKPVWSLEEAEFRLLEKGASAFPGPSIGLPERLASKTSRTVTKSVRWQSAGATLTVTPDAPKDALATQMPEIRDLCQCLGSAAVAKHGMCVGFMHCQITSAQHAIYRPENRLLDHALSFETLATVLQKRADGRCKLMHADAVRLAVPLALGLLRLHDTPWIENAWSRDRITLVSQNGKLLAEHPFITQKMMQTPASPLYVHGLAAAVIKNRDLFTLGIILIELCMEKAMSELHEANDLNPDGSKHDLSDYMTADRLLKQNEIGNRYGMRWSDTISRCIYCNLEQSKGKWSFEDASFRKAVWCEVVSPLEEDHRQFFGL